MSWICQQGAKDNGFDNNPIIITEYRRIDPKTKQIYLEFVKDTNSFNIKKYQDWRRIKMESIDSKSLLNNLRENKDHFIDPFFPHNNSVLSNENFKGQIQWKRVRDVIENAVYSKQQTLKTLQKIKLNRKQFEKALILIARSSQTLFKQLLAKTLQPEGLYEFKLFRNGYIRNVVIDDYIPTISNMPIFVGPARENEVFPMLLQKAIAKVCGSYEQIPEDAEQILQMIFCGPVHKKSISQLKEKQNLGQNLRQCMEKKQLSVLLSKKQAKIRNYGLNDNEAYHLINVHAVNIGSQSQNIYELVSQSKLSAWNGRFSLNDSVWNDVSQSKKLQLYHQIKNNASFMISQSDIGRLFDQLLIFENININNKDWCDNDSDNSFPSFTTFEVPAEDERIFIRITTPSKIRQTIIISKYIAPKKYQFITSYFNENTYKAEISVKLAKGKYIIATYHQWFFNNHGQYFVFLSSQNHIILKKGGVVDNQFLVKTILSYEDQISAKQTQNLKLYKMRTEIQHFGLAWLVLQPSNSKSRILKIDIDAEKLSSDNWDIVEPYNKIATLNVSQKTPKEESIIILRKKEIDLSKKTHFPVTAFKLKE